MPNNDAMAKYENENYEKLVRKSLTFAGLRVDQRILADFDDNLAKSAAIQKKAKDKVAKNANIGTNANPESGLTPTPDGVGTTAALRRESLADKVINTTWGKENFLFYSELRNNVRKADSTVVQYTLFDRHSPIGHGMTNYEGMISKPTDPHMVRKVLPIKYLSKTSNMTIQAAISNSIEDPMSIYEDDAITALIAQIEWECYYGDANLTSTLEKDNGLEFDGLIKLIPDENVIDHGGKTLDSTVLANAIMKIATAQGTPTDIFMPMGVKAMFVNSLQTNTGENSMAQIAIRDNDNSIYSYGFSVQTYNDPTTGRKLNISGSTVMNIPEQYDSVPVGSAGTALTPVVAAPTEKADDGGKFRIDHETGTTLNYRFVTVMSDGTMTQAADLHYKLDAGKETSSLNFKIQLPKVGENSADYVSVYRQGEDGYYWLIKRIGIRETDQDGNLNFTDRNEKIPGTFDVFVGDMSKDVIALYELLPIDYLPLAQLNASVTWTYLWFGALALMIPRRWVRITNVSSINAEFPH